MTAAFKRAPLNALRFPIINFGQFFLMYMHCIWWRYNARYFLWDTTLFFLLSGIHITLCVRWLLAHYETHLRYTAIIIHDETLRNAFGITGDTNIRTTNMTKEITLALGT